MAQLLFKKVFHESIRRGQKRTTIRRWTRPAVQAGKRAFSFGLGWLEIESVEAIDLESLTQADAVADGFATLSELRKVLRDLYPPDQDDDHKQWFRVAFRLDAKEIEAETARQQERARQRTARQPPMLPFPPA